MHALEEIHDQYINAQHIDQIELRAKSGKFRTCIG